METVTVSSRFHVEIPRAVREALRIRPGQRMQVIQYEGRIELIPLKPAKKMRGFLKGIDTTVMREANHDKLAHMEHSRLAVECAKLDPKVEQSLAEEGMEHELAAWPEYIAEQQLKLAKEMRGFLKGIDTTVEREADRT